jgi:hypothetical protein
MGQLERMSFRVEDILVQRDQISVGEDQIEILECFGKDVAKKRY